MSPWLIFFLSATAIILAGSRLTRDGDAIADGTGLGGAWVGAILIAGATSLPELLTGINAARQGHANLSLGDLFGSSMANMLILAAADLSNPRLPVLSRVTGNQVMVAALAIVLTTLALTGALAQPASLLGGIGWGPIAVVVIYILGMRLLHVNRHQGAFQSAEEVAKEAAAAPPLMGAIIGFTLSAVVIVLAAPYLASSAAAIADLLGITKGFAGMILLALTTSLPEIVVSIAGVRAWAYDIVVGNLLGSNAFNMAILLPLDIANGPRAVLASMEPAAQIGALFAILMMGQVVMGILHRPQRRVWYLEPHAIFLVLTYLAGMFLAYRSQGG